MLVAGLRSRRGSSNQLLELLRAGQWTLVLIERLRTTVAGSQEVLVEKSFTTDRDAQFSVSAHNLQSAIVPVAAR